MERPDLRLIDTETGEVHETCPNCVESERILAELERKYRGALSQIGNLRRDKAKEAEQHKLFPRARRLFDVWRRVCDHPRAKWTPDRFWEVEPRLRDYGEVRVCRAIMGGAYDPFVTRRKNGKPNRHNKWPQIMAASKFEDFEERAPARFTDSYLAAKLSPGQGALDE